MQQSSMRVVALLACAAVQGLFLSSADAQPITIGVLGDSNSDEYRADDNRGGAYASVTFNWVEILARTRNVDFGPWGTRAEPRRSGYAYNWARSGARARDLGPQQTGLAQQVRNGEVEYVIVHIGTNDIHPDGNTYRNIYNGTLSGAQLQNFLNNVTANIRSAVQEVAEAGAKVLVTGVPDAAASPEHQAKYPDPARREVVTNAINVINNALRADAERNPNIAYVDMAVFSQLVLQRLQPTGHILVGGERIDLFNRGNEPHHMRLDDESGHAGTVGNGLMANMLFLAPLNEAFGTNIPLLTDEEILCVAGILKGDECPSANPARPLPPELSLQE